MAGKAGKKKPAGVRVNDSSPADILKTEDDGSICGTAEEIIYRNDLNGYTVIGFESMGLLVTAFGIMPDVSKGDRINVWGNFENNPKYGRQFRINEYRVNIPSREDDIEHYLASGAIKGIGPKTARRIVGEFGDQTADVIENHSDYLARIPGITPKRAEEISAEFRAKSDMRSVMTFFRSYLGPAMTVRAYRHFGKNAVDTAKKSPYRFCDEIDGITFETADRMARSLGIAEDSPDRICAGIVSVLREKTAQGGHSCIEETELTVSAASSLRVSETSLMTPLDSLILSGRLVAETTDGRRMIYDREIYDNERYAAKKLCSLCRGGIAVDFGSMQALIRKSETESGITFDDDQKRAIISALSRGVLVLTGGPGTGKTTVINALCGIFESLGYEVALAAPTGRAAKRMTEATGREAKTVHRLLEVNAGGDEGEESPLLEFRRNENLPIDENVVILDEASMLDTALCCALLKAIRPGSRIVFIGDSDQLPSVGAGNVLHDLILSGTLPVVRLTHIFRQAEQSLIITNAHAINKGVMPDLSSVDRDFFFIKRRTDADTAATVADLCARRLPAAYGSDEVIQVICPSRKGSSGTENLNRVMQEMINPQGPGKKEYRHGQMLFRTGDRVMQIRNNYMLDWEMRGRHGQGIFNGDIGVILDVSNSGRYLEIDFDGRVVLYEFTDLDDLEPAYAITIHKSQGSEYPTVVIAAADVPPALRTRNMLYTAVTRAQNRVIIVGNESTVAQMVANLMPQTRHTGLCRRLKEAFGL